MNARQLWNSSTVNNGRMQIFASIIVLQYFERRYRRYNKHQARILSILSARQNQE